MYGIQRSLKPQVPPATDGAFRLESGLFTMADGETNHVLFRPLHYEAGYAYPLIVWLHGEGEDERQLLRVMPSVSSQNYVAIAPRGIPLSGADGSERCGFGWQPREERVPQAEERVLGSIEHVSEHCHIARHRVYLAGFDTGGTMALRLAMKRPEWFAGVLSLGGAFPRGGTPLGNLVAARRLRVFLAAGRFSQTYREGAICEDLRLLHSAGLLDISLRLYPCGHAISLEMLRDMNHWIMEPIIAGAEPVTAAARLAADIDQGHAGREIRGRRR